MSFVISCESPLLAKGIVQIIQTHFEDIKVLDVKHSEELRHYFDLHKPSVLVLEVNNAILGEKNFKYVLKSLIGQYETKVLFLAEALNMSDLIEYLSIGVHGYLSINVGADELVKSLNKLMKGEYIIQLAGQSERFQAEKYISKMIKKEEGYYPADILTKREYEILTLMGKGFNNYEIASTCCISEKTAKNHVSNILWKLSVRDRTCAVIKAYKNRWIAI